MKKEPEFFIGWSAKIPPKTTLFLKKLSIILAIIAVFLGLIIASSQKMISKEASFDTGEAKTYRGTLLAKPAPLIINQRGEVYLLVNPAKYGFDQKLAEKYDRKLVTVTAKLLKRESDGKNTNRMLEVVNVEASDEFIDISNFVHFWNSNLNLTGEIIDPKCYLGAMNPGNRKTHRACAINCIRGGIPPMFAVSEPLGQLILLLILGPNGEMINQAVLPFVAATINLTGDIYRLGDLWILKTDPKSFKLN